MADDLTGDERVLILRDKGRSFVSIAKELQLSSAKEAIAAFNRAFERRDPSEQEALRTREVARLDVLGERIRKRTDLSEEEIDRRLQALLRLGKALHVA
jgi:hypothetical protein